MIYDPGFMISGEMAVALNARLLIEFRRKHVLIPARQK